MAIDHLAELDQMLTDHTEVFGQSITLTGITVGAYTASSGSRAETTTTQTVSANRLPVRQGHASAGGGDGHAVMEERVYEVQASLVTGTPAPGWRITDGGATLEVLLVNLDDDRKSYTITARRTR